MWLTGELAPDHKTIANFGKTTPGDPAALRPFRQVAAARWLGLADDPGARGIAISGRGCHIVGHREEA